MIIQQAQSKILKILVVGLGNIGYKNTRHNLGADYLYYVLQNYTYKKVDTNLYIVQVNYLYILFYLTPDIMNISGKNVSRIYRKYACNKMIVFVDDLDTKLGKYKLRDNNNANGHNGIKSINEFMKFNYSIVRLGIGRPENNISDYVLQKFTEDEQKILEDMFKNIDFYQNIILKLV